MNEVANLIGNVGEIITFTTLEEKCNIKCFRHVRVPRDNKRITEVDIIGINKYGVYIIENKNCDATILGSYDSEQWDMLYGDREVYTMFNPIMQNQYHVRSLINFLHDNGIYDIPIYSYVIFNDRVKGLDIQGGNKYVFTLADFIKEYRNFNFDDTLSDFQVKLLTNIFNELKE